jgi:hypothetical protein
MFRKVTLAIAAAAALGAIALAPTAASAGGGGGGFIWHPHHHHWGPGIRIGFIGGGFDDGCYVTRPVLTPFGYRYRTVNICGY